METAHSTTTLCRPIPKMEGRIAACSAAGNQANTFPDVIWSTTVNSSYNLIGGNPMLAPLGNYGGPTQTMALLPGSPAINAGSPNGPSTDQSGVSRGSPPDIGACEDVDATFAGQQGNVSNLLAGVATPSWGQCTVAFN